MIACLEIMYCALTITIWKLLFFGMQSYLWKFQDDSIFWGEPQTVWTCFGPIFLGLKDNKPLADRYLECWLSSESIGYSLIISHQ